MIRSTQVELRFTEFYNSWVSQLEHLHYEDVLVFYTPTLWLTPLENAHFWFTGFKPPLFSTSLTHSNRNLRASALTELTEAEMKAIGDIKMRVKMEEDKVESDMERLQMSVADWKMVELAQMTCQEMFDHCDLGRKVNGLDQVAVSSILDGVEKVVKAGDCVRLKALKSVLDVLTPNQSTEFLAAIAMVHVQLRKQGLQLMSKNGPKSPNSGTDKN